MSKGHRRRTEGTADTQTAERRGEEERTSDEERGRGTTEPSLLAPKYNELAPKYNELYLHVYLRTVCT